VRSASGVTAQRLCRPGMRWLSGGWFSMGSDRFYPEEAPARRVRVEPFLIDEVPVTNAAFARFVAATGHVTQPERTPGAASAVFDPSGRGVDLRDPFSWWLLCPGADWRHPLGPGSDIANLAEHPVVHVAHADALAYATWAGKKLPTEAQWEFAARGGLDGADYAWGDVLEPGAMQMANYWQGEFPLHRIARDSWERTSPVRSFPANDFGLHDMIGNVWEWTSDWWSWPIPTWHGGAPSGCCATDPSGGDEASSRDAIFNGRVPRKVIKGGSYLCAENYCRRYRPAARHPQEVDHATSHIGFRCALTLPAGCGQGADA
jgi:formylglycine-generating enzyme